MPRNEWFHIAEVMQQREHSLINDLWDCIADYETEDGLPHGMRQVSIILNRHLKSTGRQENVSPKLKELSQVDSDTRSRLLALCRPSGEQAEASSQPIQVQVQKLTKSGKPRKQRSDKGQPRGRRVDKK